MFKLMIADDEQIALEGIKFIIEEFFDNIEIVDMVSSGRMIIESAQKVVPDIVIMDIKMPGINGIEAIETIKKSHHNIKFIIISAYEQFEYAKQAVELGVSDYIVKPVNRFKIIDVLRKVMSEIEKERKQQLKELENCEKIEKVIPILEHGFIYSLYMNTDYRQELYKYYELFKINKELAYIMVLEFGEGEKYVKLQNKIGTGVKGQKFYPKVQNLIKYKCKCIIGPMIVNRITVLVYEEEFEKEYEQRINAIKLAENIFDSISGCIDSDLYMGIGSCYSLDKIKYSLEEALYALNRISDENILHVNDILGIKINETNYTYVDIKGDETHIIQLIESGQEDELVNELNIFFNKIEKRFNNSRIEMINITTELMVMVFSCSYRNNLDEREVGYSTYLNELRKIDNIVEIQNWCIRKILYITQMIHSKRHQHVSKVVIKAKEFIDEHYNQEVSLIDISKEVSVSPQYFSKIFKEEIGISFVEYVREKRIDIAKKMLRSKQYSVKEICYKIGYNDPNYFSRLFKRLVGVSPTDFN